MEDTLPTIRLEFGRRVTLQRRGGGPPPPARGGHHEQGRREVENRLTLMTLFGVGDG
jgi:hypothetical protein